MKTSLQELIQPDNIAHYLAHNIYILPDVYDVFLEQLEKQQWHGKLCLVPISIFQRFHTKLRKAS